MCENVESEGSVSEGSGVSHDCGISQSSMPELSGYRVETNKCLQCWSFSAYGRPKVKDC